MRAAEEAAFASGVRVEALMNKAGAGVAQAVTKFFHKPGRCIVFAGKGHNAGDALFAAQCLERRGWKIEVRLAFTEADCSALMRKKLADLCRRPLPPIACPAPEMTTQRDNGHVPRYRDHRPRFPDMSEILWVILALICTITKAEIVAGRGPHPPSFYDETP